MTRPTPPSALSLSSNFNKDRVLWEYRGMHSDNLLTVLCSEWQDYVYLSSGRIDMSALYLWYLYNWLSYWYDCCCK
ncbi:hypothetical protein Hamer_G003598 [Homarus americanus]|uniref:Uncharacterized protein n=1 Tax=Homarus americanus TaxID=6706 RepID=A0A8J5MU26_HOMAM|nr:hypothetical protein Hamer_G003598 [Homarus americanus]